jgi:nucleotide-binding universal stress UspA family protein
MEWKPVVVGVDTSPAATHAAAVGWTIAYSTGTSCHLVHAAPNAWAGVAAAEVPVDLEVLNRSLIDDTRIRIEGALRGNVPDPAFEHLEVRIGPTAAVLSEAAADLGAGLVVLGGKHHSLLARWLGGSTAHHVVRTSDIPTLVTGSSAINIRRVLAAADLSYAAGPTIEAAVRFAGLFKASLRVLHVVELVPALQDLPSPVDIDELAARSEELLERSVWPMIEYEDSEHVVRRGPAAQTIAAEATEWQADLLVVGSHGKGAVDRLVVGSATNWLLNHLPTSVLVVPVFTPQGGATWLAKRPS